MLEKDLIIAEIIIKKIKQEYVGKVNYNLITEFVGLKANEAYQEKID